MPRKDLKKKPLVEAILEVKWALASTSPSAPSPVSIDPHYRLLMGRFFERVREDYPFYEALPTASVPDEMVAQMAQHRFRVRENAWPLIQLGPGLLTVNETAGYTWPDFQERCVKAITTLVDAHPAPQHLNVESLLLRYIDAVDFDFATESIFGFLNEKMKIAITLPESLFDGGADAKPAAFNWQASFPLRVPDGIITLRFATGRGQDKKPLLIWETVVLSKRPKVPRLPDNFPEWLDASHTMTDDWFFKLIEGELERRFSGE